MSDHEKQKQDIPLSFWAIVKELRETAQSVVVKSTPGGAAIMVSRLRDSERTRLFREAQHLYQDYLNRELVFAGGDPNFPTPEQSALARSNPSLHGAIKTFQRVVRIADEDNCVQQIGVCWAQLGMIYHLQNRTPEAISAVEQALEILEDLPQIDHDTLATISNCYFYLGLLEMQRPNYSRARKCLEKSKALDEANGDLFERAVCADALRRCGEMSTGDNAGGNDGD